MNHDTDPDRNHDEEALERTLRGALAERAGAVRPADALPEIMRRSRLRRRRVRAGAVLVGVAASGVVAVGAYAATQGGDAVRTIAANPTTEVVPTVTVPATPVPTSPPAGATASAAPGASETPAPATSAPASSAPPASATPLPARGGAVPVYFLGGDEAPKLFREFLTPTAGTATNDATRALRAMLGATPTDPDYVSVWGPDPDATVELRGGRLVVDLAASAAAGDVELGSPELARQELVWTVTAAAGRNAPVEILVDGRSGGTLFGEPVPTTLTRAPQAEVQAHAWILDLDTRTPGQVVVGGIGTGFEGTLLVSATDAAGTEVAREPVQAGANGQFGAFTTTLSLPAGTWTITAWEPDESDGEATAQVPDTKTVVVD